LSLRGGNWMKTHDRFSHTWRELARRHGCETTRAEVVLDELLRAYSEPTRKYHTIEHIGSLLRKLDEHDHAVVDRDAVVLAMLFHDVVYDPRRHDKGLAGRALTSLLWQHRTRHINPGRQSVDRSGELPPPRQHIVLIVAPECGIATQPVHRVIVRTAVWTFSRRCNRSSDQRQGQRQP
jgi:hypothetical protein